MAKELDKYFGWKERGYQNLMVYYY